MSITPDRFHINHSRFTDFQKRHVEGTTAQIKDQNVFIIMPCLVSHMVQTVSNCSCSRLVYQLHHIEASKGSCFLCCFSLIVVKISRNGDHSICYLSSDKSFSRLFQLLENHGR
ncbi:putative glutamate dehydrogenase, NAD-specific [Helianthus annuus]|nr:putative glutamate dehydrogenase, NAD-specific [Helianthus annuus]